MDCKKWNYKNPLKLKINAPEIPGSIIAQIATAPEIKIYK